MYVLHVIESLFAKVWYIKTATVLGKKLSNALYLSVNY